MDTYAVDTYAGNTYAVDTYAVDTYAGNTYAMDTYAGNTYAVHTYAGVSKFACCRNPPLTADCFTLALVNMDVFSCFLLDGTSLN